MTELKLKLPEWTLRLEEAGEEVNKHLLAVEISTNVDYKAKLSEQKARLKERNYTYAELLDLTAMLILEEELNDLQIQFKDSQIDGQELMIEYLGVCTEEQKRIIETVKKLDGLSEICSDAAAVLEAKCEKYSRYQKKKKAADIGHDREGGSREKREKIRLLWATGKYSSRDICAEQECAALDMSFSVARKALRNTPDPT